jgi:hypothetical protein
MDICCDEWVYFTPNTEDVYTITVYDDGNQEFKQYANEWLINGQWRGKCALINVKDPTITINSISKWKLCTFF